MISWEVEQIDKICNYCEKEAKYNLIAYGFFKRYTRVLCKEHKIQWYNKTLKL